MSPEDYELHRERVLYLSEHPLIESDETRELDDEQLTLREVAD